MSLLTWLFFILTVFFVSATPGPNMLLAMTQGIQHGLRRALISCAGMMIGLGLIMTASVVGLAALLAAVPVLFLIVKYVGAAYLIVLGIKSWRTPMVSIYKSGQEQPSTNRFSLLRTGFLVSLSNPKAIIFFAALFPQFIDPARPRAAQLSILAATFFAIETCWQFAYAAGGSRLTLWLSGESEQRLLNRLSGTAFIAAGVLLGAFVNK